MNPPVILVVDHDPAFRALAQSALQAKYVVKEASDGPGTLEAVSRFPVELVLLSMSLPGVDGFELAQFLASSGAEGPAIVGLTGPDAAGEFPGADWSDFSTYAPKPGEASRLVELVRGALPPRKRAVVAGPVVRRILLVEDSPTQLKLLKLQLEEQGFQVDIARNGVHALECARRETFDAIVSDVIMPFLDGFRLCEEIRKDPKLRHLPVVLISSSYNEASSEKLARGAGANALIIRTSDADATIEKVLNALATNLTHN